VLLGALALALTSDNARASEDQAAESLTFEGHTSHVRSVAFSPDGKRIVSGSADRAVKVWETGPSRE
jgi:WD40 repeat protein